MPSPTTSSSSGVGEVARTWESWLVAVPASPTRATGKEVKDEQD